VMGEAHRALPIHQRRVFLKTLGIPLRQGAADRGERFEKALPVIISDEAWRKRVFTGKNPVGQRFWRGRNEREAVSR